METATDTTETGEGRQRHLYVPSNSVGQFYPPEEDLSLADKMAMLSSDEREEILSELDMEELEHSAEFWMRPSQLAAINSDHWMTVCLAGRGWGKTRVLSEAIHKYAMDNPGARMALVGRTTSDVRDVLILGDSGILEVTPPDERPRYRPMVRRVVWENGAEAMTFSAERPDGIRGAQFHAAFCDEIGSYRTNSGSSLMNAFDQIKVATRLGEFPKIFVATTPRRVPQIIDLVEQADKKPDQVLLIRGSTLANRHLSESYKEVITGMYDGTALGRQEIEGELLSDVEGALLHQGVIDEHRRDDVPDEFWKSLPYRVVGVDPSVSATPKDECGIVVCGATAEKKLYKRDGFVLEDASVLGPPAVWAKEVVRMARKYRAVVVAEDNQGGEMVRMVIQEQDPKVPVTLVRSKAGKKARAEPVGLAYERGRVHHTDWFGLLESQLTTWAPDEGMASPDRLDALTHALTALLVNPPKQWVGGVRTRNAGAGKNIPVENHDPLRYARAGNINGRSTGALRRQLAQIEGVAKKDTLPHEYDETIDANAPRQKQMRARQRLSGGTPSSRQGGLHRGSYASPGTRIRR